MTVKELIEELQKMPPDLEVRYEDYEQGDSEIREVELKPSGAWTSNPYVSIG